MNIITLDAINKKFGEVSAASDISINVNKGEIYGLLGLNGAGKTTLIRIMLGMTTPDSGKVLLFNHLVNSKFCKWNHVGYLIETPRSYPNLNVYDNLKHFSYLRERDPKEIDEIIDLLRLNKFRKTLAKNLSLGNGQRLGLAKAIMHRPELIILDEPVNGLDPAGIVEIRNLLKHLSSQGTTVFISSHNLDEIWKIVDQIGIIDSGSLLESRSKSEISKNISKKIKVTTRHLSKSIELIKNLNHNPTTIDAKTLVVEITNNNKLRSEFLIEQLYQAAAIPEEVTIIEESLEQYFLNTISKHQ